MSERMFFNIRAKKSADEFFFKNAGALRTALSTGASTSRRTLSLNTSKLLIRPLNTQLDQPRYHYHPYSLLEGNRPREEEE